MWSSTFFFFSTLPIPCSYSLPFSCSLVFPLSSSPLFHRLVVKEGVVAERMRRRSEVKRRRASFVLYYVDSFGPIAPSFLLFSLFLPSAVFHILSQTMTDLKSGIFSPLCHFLLPAAHPLVLLPCPLLFYFLIPHPLHPYFFTSSSSPFLLFYLLILFFPLYPFLCFIRLTHWKIKMTRRRGRG